MAFNSLTFAVFFAGVLALHNLPLGWTAKIAGRDLPAAKLDIGGTGTRAAEADAASGDAAKL